MARASSKRMKDDAARIDEIIAAFPPAQASALTSLRSTLRRLLPGSQEVVGWNMPGIKVGSDQVVHYLGFAHHNSIFPGPHVAAIIGDEYTDLTTTKGTIHLDRDRPALVSLMRRIVSLRIAEINDSYPRANGKARRYYTNGFTEYTGAIRDGQMHGPWEWFRRNGTIKRSGRFKAGKQVGPWITYDTSGNPYRTTDMG